MEDALSIVKQAREYFISNIQRYGRKIRERDQDLGGLMILGGLDIPLPPYCSEKERYPAHAELIDHIAHGLGMFAEAVEKGYTLERSDKVFFASIELIFDEKQLILNKIRREVSKIGRENGYQEFPSIKIGPDKTIDDVLPELIPKLSESLDPSQEWKKGKPPKTYEKAREREAELRTMIDDMFASPEFIDLQRFPYPKWSAKYIKELQKNISNYFDRFGRMANALQKRGIDIENLNLV